MMHKPAWDHQRAAHAWGKIKEMQQLQPRVRDAYASYVVSLPAAILMNGLGQALAQLKAAAKPMENEPHELLYQHMQDWLCQDVPQAPYPSALDLIEAIMKHDRKTYNWAVQEGLFWLKWHKKLAVSHLKIREEQDASTTISDLS